MAQAACSGETGRSGPRPTEGRAAGTSRRFVRPIADGTIAIIDRGGRQKRMAERKSFLLVAMAAGAGGIAVGAYVMWEMLVRVTGP